MSCYGQQPGFTGLPMRRPSSISSANPAAVAEFRPLSPGTTSMSVLKSSSQRLFGCSTLLNSTYMSCMARVSFIFSLYILQNVVLMAYIYIYIDHQLVLDGAVSSSGVWSQYKSDGEQFICNCVGKGNNNVQKTAGGLLWFLPWANLQYVGSASLVAVSYASYLSTHKANLQCSGGTVTPSDLFTFARSQVYNNCRSFRVFIQISVKIRVYVLFSSVNEKKKLFYTGKVLVSIFLLHEREGVRNCFKEIVFFVGLK